MIIALIAAVLTEPTRADTFDLDDLTGTWRGSIDYASVAHDGARQYAEADEERQPITLSPITVLMQVAAMPDGVHSLSFWLADQQVSEPNSVLAIADSWFVLRRWRPIEPTFVLVPFGVAVPRSTPISASIGHYRADTGRLEAELVNSRIPTAPAASVTLRIVFLPVASNQIVMHAFMQSEEFAQVFSFYFCRVE